MCLLLKQMIPFQIFLVDIMQYKLLLVLYHFRSVPCKMSTFHFTGSIPIHWLFICIVNNYYFSLHSLSSEPLKTSQVKYHVWNKLPVQVWCTILNAWGWCTGTTKRDGMGREEGGGFRMGNTCIPVADSFWYLAKLIQLCKV